MLRPLKANINYADNTIQFGNHSLTLFVKSKDTGKIEKSVISGKDLSNNIKPNLVLKSENIIALHEDNTNFNIIEEKEYQPLREQIRTQHLNLEEKNKLMPIINKYSDIFYQENTKLSFTSAIKHKIRTINNVPIFTKSYRYPYIHKEEVEKQI